MSRALVALAGLTAIGYLIAMVVTGALPQQRQRVQFEARGVMQLAPERVVRVELTRGADRAVFVRGPGVGWTREGAGSLAAPLAEKLSMAVQFMHTAGPVRVLEPAELGGADSRAFGLDGPVLSVALHADAGPVLRVKFGGRNPDDMLQYMAIEGRPGLVLMSRFVGQEWLAVAEGVFSGR
ncbi:MAG TPA: hypothetical protein VLC47_02900 [Burkholderiales bacterium]|nr:hypothetical protein [Burkholderiales bacterium]